MREPLQLKIQETKPWRWIAERTRDPQAKDTGGWRPAYREEAWDRKEKGQLLPVKGKFLRCCTRGAKEERV